MFLILNFLSNSLTFFLSHYFFPFILYSLFIPFLFTAILIYLIHFIYFSYLALLWLPYFWPIMPFVFIINPSRAAPSFFCAILRFSFSFLHTFIFIIFISYPFITVAFEVHFLFLIKSLLTSLLSPILQSSVRLPIFFAFSSSILGFTPLLWVLIATYLQIPLDFSLSCHLVDFTFTLIRFYFWLKSVKLITVLNSLPPV